MALAIMRGKWVAQALHKWLPLVIQAAKPWMSADNIDKGSRGLAEVSANLSGMKVEICCLTPENLNSPWILYEAGALSKTIDDKTRLCTYLLGGIQFQDVEAPLGMFQATKADKDETRALVSTINKAISDPPVPESNLSLVFDALWSQLEEKLKAIPRAEEVAATKRSVEDIVAEILEISRAEANNRKSLEGQVSNIETILSRSPYGNLNWELGKGDAGIFGSTIRLNPNMTAVDIANTVGLASLLDSRPAVTGAKDTVPGKKKDSK